MVNEMASFSDYLEDVLLDHIVGKTSYAMPTAYAALDDTGISDSNTGTTISEPVGNGYARVATAGADWNASSAGSISNVNDITFPEASGSWGTILDFCLCDASSDGNLLAWGVLSASKAVGDGDTVKFAGGTPGAFVITLD